MLFYGPKHHLVVTCVIYIVNIVLVFSYTLEDEIIILLQPPETIKKNLVPSVGPSVPVAMTTPTVPTTPGPNGTSYIQMYTCICLKYRFSLVPLH